MSNQNSDQEFIAAIVTRGWVFGEELSRLTAIAIRNVPQSHLLTGKIVPIEPTLAQQRAGMNVMKELYPRESSPIGAYRVYEEMLKAAP